MNDMHVFNCIIAIEKSPNWWFLCCTTDTFCSRSSNYWFITCSTNPLFAYCKDLMAEENFLMGVIYKNKGTANKEEKPYFSFLLLYYKFVRWVYSYKPVVKVPTKERVSVKDGFLGQKPECREVLIMWHMVWEYIISWDFMHCYVHQATSEWVPQNCLYLLKGKST